MITSAYSNNPLKVVTGVMRSCPWGSYRPGWRVVADFKPEMPAGSYR